MTELILARHGETDWNAERRIQGHTDRPLNSNGEAQARGLAEALQGEQLDAVYSSDLARAYDTASVVASARGLPVVAVPDLRERDFGTWEGLTDDEILERFPDAETRPWGDAETHEQLERRVLDALQRIADRHPGERVLVVTHGGPFRAVLRRCDVALEGPIVNGHVARFAFRDGSLRPID